MLFTVSVICVATIISTIVYYSTVHQLERRMQLNLVRTGRTVEKLLKSECFNNNLYGTDNDSLFQLQAISIKWRDLFSKYLINPYNYFFRIYDSEKRIIWFTENISDSQDTAINIVPSNFNYISLSSSKRKLTPKFLSYYSFENYINSQNKEIIRTDILRGKIFRIFTFKSNNLIITLAQPNQYFEDFKFTLKLTFGMLIFFSGLIAYILAKIFLKNPFAYLEELSKSLNLIDIRSKNIEIPVAPNYNEFQLLSNNVNDILKNMTEGYSKLSKFSADVAHELKTPLTILRGELSLALQNRRKPDEYELVIASALEESVRLSGVVDALLELARAETGQIKMIFKKENLSELVKEIAEDCEILAEEKDILINSNIESNIIINFDADRMHQAILNIIDNAVKYTPKKGFISIDFRKTIDNYAELRIIDTGIGISQDDLEKVFERFFRTDDVKMKSISGLGLGLTMVKWIVNAHNGKIEIQSKVGNGTAFIVKIPMNL